MKSYRIKASFVGPENRLTNFSQAYDSILMFLVIDKLHVLNLFKSLNLSQDVNGVYLNIKE